MSNRSLCRSLLFNLKFSALLVFGLFVSTIFVFHLAFAFVNNNNPDCGLYTVRTDCDLSGWTKLFIGDIGIAAVLAILLHIFTHRNQKKIELIIAGEEQLKARRHNYSISHLRNLLHLVLFTMSVIKRSINQYNSASAEKESGRQMWIESNTLARMRADEAKLGRLLQSIRNLMVASNDVLDPEIVNRVDGVCNFIGEISAEETMDGKLWFPKYEVCRIKLEYLLELIQTEQSSQIRQKEIRIEHGKRPATIPSSVPEKVEV
jgi:hypothetical protein